MYRELQTRLLDRIREYLRTQGVADVVLAIEQPPNVALGEYAIPVFSLAKILRKPPKKIAEEIVAGLGEVPGFAKFEIAGAGYINARVNRAAMAAEMMRGMTAGVSPAATKVSSAATKVLVEHTSINPNKAAHIGHLRNAILGDTFVRLLRAAGHPVDVQNYIDNTGVQVADVVAGFLFQENKSKQQILDLVRTDPRFDYTCWDVYARVSQWYAEDKQNQARRVEVLHALEAGGNDIAEIGEAVSTAIVKCHLRTMDRLAIEYDFLPRESEILHLRFWEAAFEQLKAKGVLRYQEQGAKKGCWVMTRAAAAAAGGPVADEDLAVIVRSNGTVVYEGKDIAYHLWKFGVLGRDFAYRRFFQYANGRDVWVSAEKGEADHPHFGGVGEIYNVIDARQAEAQNVVIEALRRLGYTEQAERYHHFSYEMVALTPRCAEELGYDISDEDKQRSYIEVSGRKGFGVKADDLIDRLIASAKKEVDARHAELSDAERRAIATQIAVGALRYFMLKFTKNSVIAFDFKEALSFEGETGPYAQYAVVRATNIFRKAGIEPEAALNAGEGFATPAVPAPTQAPEFAEFMTDEIWELWLAASKTGFIIDQCIATTEPAYIAKHAFQVAQAFNNFYHRHHILNEPDERRKRFLLATAAVVRRELIGMLAVMGVEAPPVM
jgi:arginyl-tRNA synthetase